ncbi:type I toxin-antitoxin system toxin IbsC [Escherichia coli]|nr:type I toxin-antitoxin system toxin IbsC [Escherichia coli]MCH0679309.1 type I toxin-antitoxin system toxin IbsC [Escherichia coli]
MMRLVIMLIVLLLISFSAY